MTCRFVISCALCDAVAFAASRPASPPPNICIGAAELVASSAGANRRDGIMRDIQRQRRAP
jgi:hypothetical protein